LDINKLATKENGVARNKSSNPILFYIVTAAEQNTQDESS